MIKRDFELFIGALELGIVPPCENISKCLITLSSEDARKAKRKFRKLKRKIPELRHMTQSDIRNHIMRKCQAVGGELLAGQDQK